MTVFLETEFQKNMSRVLFFSSLQVFQQLLFYKYTKLHELKSFGYVRASAFFFLNLHFCLKKYLSAVLYAKTWVWVMLC